VDRAEGVRIEKNRAAAARWYIARHQALRPEHGATIIEVAGGVAAWPSSQGSPSMGKAIAVALDGEMTPSDLDRIEVFYAEAGVPAKLSLCPFTDASAFALMAEHRYVIVDHFNVLSRSLDDLPAPPLSVSVARADDYDAWTALVRGGMGEPQEDPLRAETIAVVLGQAPQMHAFVATVSGSAAAGAGLLVDEGIATLFATSTLPAFRRRGAQASLVAARLAHAKALGCDLAVAMTDVGGDSQRNLERLGFRVGYTATVFGGP
jgi:GNAT superfamily N-acetyltransferase